MLDAFSRPLKDLRISVTDRCNFRCPYCMPIEIFGENNSNLFMPRKEMLSYEEIARLSKIFVELGVQKLRLTGGEPLLRKDLPRLIELLSGCGAADVTLTTNGWFLKEHAQSLKDAGLQRVTISLDSLNPQSFGRMNGRGYRPERVLEAIEHAKQVGLAPLKVNMVVQRGMNDEEILEVAGYFRGSEIIVRFIEYMDVGTCNGWKLDQVVSAAQIRERIHQQWPLELVAPNQQGEVAQRYQYVDGQGEVGFIASITEPFCGDCNRARLAADGRLITCLFAETGPSLRDPLRVGASDEEMRAVIENIWHVRADRYSELRSESEVMNSTPKPKIEMYRIGG